MGVGVPFPLVLVRAVACNILRKRHGGARASLGAKGGCWLLVTSYPPPPLQGRSNKISGPIGTCGWTALIKKTSGSEKRPLTSEPTDQAQTKRGCCGGLIVSCAECDVTQALGTRHCQPPARRTPAGRPPSRHLRTSATRARVRLIPRPGVPLLGRPVALSHQPPVACHRAMTSVLAFAEATLIAEAAACVTHTTHARDVKIPGHVLRCAPRLPLFFMPSYT